MWCIVLYRIVSYYVVLYCIVLYCIVLYCIVLYCIVSYRIVLCCIVLYYIILCCVAYCCVVLCCIYTNYWMCHRTLSTTAPLSLSLSLTHTLTPSSLFLIFRWTLVFIKFCFTWHLQRLRSVFWMVQQTFWKHGRRWKLWWWIWSVLIIWCHNVLHLVVWGSIGLEYTLLYCHSIAYPIILYQVKSFYIMS